MTSRPFPSLKQTLISTANRQRLLGKLQSVVGILRGQKDGHAARGDLAHIAENLIHDIVAKVLVSNGMGTDTSTPGGVRGV